MVDRLPCVCLKLSDKDDPWTANLCLTRRDPSSQASLGCPCGPCPCPQVFAGGLAASAGASAPSPGYLAGADSSGPSLQVSEGERERERFRGIIVYSSITFAVIV